jgi:transcriptional regulator with XRE-family HTH domain
MSKSISAREQMDAIRGRKSPVGVETNVQSDGSTGITISAEAANQLLGVGTGGRGADQLTEHRFRPQVSGLELLRYNHLEVERLRHGLTVAELASASGLPVSLVERLEAADDISEAHREQLAAGLGLDVNTVFPLSSTPDSGPDQKSFRPLPTPDRADIAEAHEREQDEALSAYHDAKTAAAMDAAYARLVDLKRDLQVRQLSDQAAALGKRIDRL